MSSNRLIHKTIVEQYRDQKKNGSFLSIKV
jgi:hypothetical protein